MTIALIVVGLFILIVLFSWVYAYLNDAEEIDVEAQKEVRQESPQEHERAKAEEKIKEASENAEDIELYSHETE